MKLLSLNPGESQTPNKIAKCLNEDLCEVKFVLESAAENGVLTKEGRKFYWSRSMKYPKKLRCPLSKRRLRRKKCN